MNKFRDSVSKIHERVDTRMKTMIELTFRPGSGLRQSYRTPFKMLAQSKILILVDVAKAVFLLTQNLAPAPFRPNVFFFLCKVFRVVLRQSICMRQ